MAPPSNHDRYDLLRPLGRGGMACVHLAREVDTGREVALKALSLPEGARLDEWRLRFQQEFHTTARLRHRHIVATYDYAEGRDGLPFFTMEFLPGPGLEELVGAPVARIAQLLPGLLQALGYLHHQGLVHGDLKPENIRLAQDGTVRLMDLGLVSRAGQHAAGLQGTLAYMAPEAIRRAPADRRSDLYALGAVLYHLLAGAPPFVGDTRQVLMGHLELAPKPLQEVRPEAGERLAALVDRLLAKDPLQRFQSAQEALRFLGAASAPGVAAGGSGPLEDDQTLFHPPLVGRAAELSELTDALERARTSYQEVWVAGDADVGLAPLLEEFCCRAQLAGATVLRGAFQRRQGPFEGLRGVVRGLVALNRQRPEALGALTPVLARVLPELGAPAPAVGDPQQERLRVLDALTQLAKAAAESGPLVLALSDAQWGDAGWREWLEHLRRNAAERPVLIVATAVGELELDWDPCRTEVALEPLGAPAFTEACRAILGQAELPSAFVERAREASGGYIARLERLLRRLAESGRIRRYNGVWTLPDEPLAHVLDASEEFWALDQGLKKLPALAHQALLVLAARGRETPLWLLWRILSDATEAGPSAADLVSDAAPATAAESAAPADGGPLFEALGALEVGGWVHSRDGHVALSLDHDRDAVLGTQPTEARRALHARIARALARALADAPDDLALLAELAGHALAADDPRGPAHALEAARQHARFFDLEAAEGLLRDAIEHLSLAGPAHPAAEGAVALELWRLRADVARLAGDRRLAESAYARALALAEARGDAEAEAALANGYGRLKAASGEAAEARSRFARVLEALGPATVHPEVALALTWTGKLALNEGDLAGARPWVERALALSRQGGFRPLVRENMAQLGYLYVATGRDQAAEGLGLLFEALQMTEKDEAKLELNACYALLGNAQLLLGRFGEARVAFERNCDLCAEVGAAPHDEATAFMKRAQVELELGDYRAARKAAGPAGALARMVGNKLLLAQVRLLEGMAALYQGDFTIYQDAAAWVEDALQATQSEALAAMYHTCRAEAEGFLGQWSPALSSANRALELMASGAGHEYRERAQLLKGEALTRLGLYKPAKTELEALGQPRNEAIHARLLLALAQLERQSGARAQALTLAQRALQLAHRAGVVPVSAACGLLLAMLADRREASLAYARKALLDAEACEQPALEAEAYHQAFKSASRADQAESYLQAAVEAFRRATAGLTPAMATSFGATEERRPIAEVIRQREAEGYRVTPADQRALLELLAGPITPAAFLPAVAAFCQNPRAERVAIFWEDAHGQPVPAYAEGPAFNDGLTAAAELEAAAAAARQGAGVALVPLQTGTTPPWGAVLVTGLAPESRDRLEKLLPFLAGALGACRALALQPATRPTTSVQA